MRVEDVMNCLNESHLRLGPSLRARTLLHKNRIYPNFHEKIISIGDPNQRNEKGGDDEKIDEQEGG